MDLNRRDLMKAALISPVSGVIYATAPETVVGAVPVQPEVSDWDWPPHSPGECYVFRQRLRTPPMVSITQEQNAVNRVPWRGCKARTVKIERIEATLLNDDSWRLLRFLKHEPDTFDIRVIDSGYPGSGIKTFHVVQSIMFQGIDFGEMWQPWDGTWA